jgi:hypothetical protein
MAGKAITFRFGTHVQVQPSTTSAIGYAKSNQKQFFKENPH